MGFKAYEYADRLKAENAACLVDGIPAAFMGGKFETGKEGIERILMMKDKTLTTSNRREVYNSFMLTAKREKPAPPYFVAFSNGVLDVRDGHMGAFDPKATRILNTIPHDYDEGAYDERTDAFLDEVSCGDGAIRANLEETIGLCMYRSNEFGRMVVLVNKRGSNGKSMFIRALRAALGEENTAALDVATIGKRFMSGMLAGKLANLGDDISNEMLSGDKLAEIKKIVTGERLFTDQKGVDGYEFTPYCTLVFSANEIPRLGDSGNGVMRRLHPIPFNAHFTRENADPGLGRKLTTEGASKYLLRLGVEGLRRVMENGEMTPNGASSQIVQQVRLDNDSILSWIDSEGINPGEFVGRRKGDVYNDYKDWCLEGCLKPKSNRAFYSWMMEHYGIGGKKVRDGHRTFTAFCMASEDGATA